MKFPELPRFAGVNAPCRVELDLQDLEFEGEIPREIDGAVYRVAADHQFPSLFSQDVPFNGDGMVSMFRFQNGRVHLKSRYVQTDRCKAERAAGRALFGRSRQQVARGGGQTLGPALTKGCTCSTTTITSQCSTAAMTLRSWNGSTHRMWCSVAVPASTRA
jgi:carotenoid cleavage dioxygenase-like enzyme